jgi:GT2 family glycosyltransferase
MPKVSLVTINYNNAQVTCQLLASVEGFNRELFEVIVVDNNSKEDPSSIAKLFPWIHFVQSDINLGFAGGNNLGINHATGQYIFLVNNDTEFKEDIISKLSEVLDADHSVGIVCPVLRYFDAPQPIQFTGFTKISLITGRNQCLTSLSSETSHSAYAHGAAMMFPKRIYDQVGAMAEQYFLYYEELDWSSRVAESGYKISVDPRCTLFHKESQSVGRVSELKSYFMARNRILFMRRNSSVISKMLFWCYFLSLATPKQIVSFAIDKQWKNIQAHLMGICWHLLYSKHSNKIGFKFNSLRS